MELSVARKTVDKNIDKILAEFLLEDWDILIEYGQIEGGTLGECKALSKYKEARIKLNYENLVNKDHLIEILRHELLHLITLKLDALRDMLNEILTTDQFKMVDSLLSHTVERIITHLELMLARKGKKSGRR